MPNWNAVGEELKIFGGGIKNNFGGARGLFGAARSGGVKGFGSAARGMGADLMGYLGQKGISDNRRFMRGAMVGAAAIGGAGAMYVGATNQNPAIRTARNVAMFAGGGIGLSMAAYYGAKKAGWSGFSGAAKNAATSAFNPDGFAHMF